jgi:hypothetical protein
MTTTISGSRVCFLVVLLAALALSACETVDKRIARDQTYFEQLPDEQQQLIRSGGIRNGMTARDVIIAWGQPGRVIRSEAVDGQRERWVYIVTRTYTYYRPGRYYDRYLHPWSVYDVPYTVYRRFVTREVILVNDRVVEWSVPDRPIPYEAYRW